MDHAPGAKWDYNNTGLALLSPVFQKATGQQIFDRKIYYFDQIPTNVETLSVVLVNFGALAICVMSSILPAFRAARLHPVQALRFE